MITCIYPLDKASHKRIISNIHLGLGSASQLVGLDYFQKYDRLPAGTTSVVFAGIIRGFGQLYKYCMENAIDFYYVDHAYFNAGYDDKNEWVRITHNNFVQNSIKQDVDSKRHAKHFSDVSIQPWQKRRGEHILILPPTQAVCDLFGVNADDWMKKTSELIGGKSQLPIKIREKSETLVLDKNGKILERKINKYDTTLEEDINASDCVVSFNSNVAVQAALLGIPVISTSYGAAFPISNRFDNIGVYVYPDRQDWLYSLTYSQFCTRELQDGSAFEILRKYK